jgi:asparaginyl-tRNA synthetase
MKRSTIQGAIDSKASKVLLKGWVHRKRSSSKLAFIILRDASDTIQCVFKQDEVDKETWETATTANIESSIMCEGELKKDERAPSGYELQGSRARFISKGEPFPIARDFSPEFLLDVRHLWLRSSKLASILKIRSTVTGAIHEFFRSRGYYEFTPPIFTPAACEGGSTLFEVKYFGKKVYLTQSWQLYAEAAIFALEKVYDNSPTFRSEKSSTSRHLAEFWMAEMEAAFMDYRECSEVGKAEVQFIIGEVLKKNRKELELLKRDLADLKLAAKGPYPTITYTQALKLLKQKKAMDVPWGKDLRTLEERNLMELFNTPVVITHYPKEIMAFYKPVDAEDTEAPGPVCKCFDMIAPVVGELIGGSERSTDIDELTKNLKAEGEKLENYKFYLDLRRYGSVPHSGYGLGVERLLQWITGLDTIKDAIPFPRTIDRWNP